MSERMTSIHLPNIKDPGWSDYGRLTHKEMVEQYREHAAYSLEWAQKVLAAKPEDFVVETYVGIHVQRKRETIEPTTSEMDE